MAVLLYGANGYTGRLIAEMATSRQIPLILAGRNQATLEAMSKKLAVPYRIFALDDFENITRNLDGVTVVLHAAGPFELTAEAMVEACLARRVHYTDITGEISVFEAMANRDHQAKSAGIMVMPGVGFDVVPSDCLASHLHRRLPSADFLELAFMGLGRVSHGTAKTMILNMPRGGMIRQEGKLTNVRSAYKTRSIDFGRGPVSSVSIPWGDVSTAFHSTGIPNIMVYSVFPKEMVRSMKWTYPIRGLFGLGLVQWFLKRMVDRQPAGPSEAERQSGWTVVWGEARNSRSGEVVQSRLRGPEGYTWTALTALALMEKILAGEAKPGFQTPSKAFGPELVMEIPGVSREDLQLPSH